MFSNKYIKTRDFPKSRGVQLFAWPVHCWEVYLSSHRGRELNLFERAILELIRVTGDRELSADDIATWLCLEKEMVIYILTATLQPNGWLDKHFKITENGRKILDSELEPEMETASVFQCAVTGQWFPRIAYKSITIKPEKYNHSRVTFKLDRATDRTVRAYPVREQLQEISRPAVADLEGLLIKDKEARYIANHISEERFLLPINAEKMLLSDKEVEQAYLLLWANTSSEVKFDFFDPVGLISEAPWMNELFEQARNADDKLEEFTCSTFGFSEQGLSYQEAVDLMKEAAQVEVLSRYPNAERCEDLSEQLFELMKGKERLNREKEPDYGLNRMLINTCGSSLEALFIATLKDYPFKRLHTLPGKNVPNYEKTRELEILLKDIGKFSQSQIKNILTVQPGKLFQTAKGNNSSLRSLLATIFISMRDYPHHPLLFIINDNELFDDVYKLSHDRDEATHSNKTRFTNEQTLHCLNVVDRVLNNMLVG